MRWPGTPAGTDHPGDRPALDVRLPQPSEPVALSLHVMLDKQGWYCFGCRVGGDVLQLVEFIQTGSVTAGQSGPMPDSHRQARDYLAKKAGLPPLSRYGLSQGASGPDGGRPRLRTAGSRTR